MKPTRCILLLIVFFGQLPAAVLSARHLAPKTAFEPLYDSKHTFAWRAPGIDVLFGDAGRISFRIQGQRPFRLEFQGAESHSRPVPEQKTAGEHFYYLGSDPSQWRSHVARYEKLRYSGIYAGVDVVFRITSDGLEYDLEVAPHSSVDLIRLQFPDLEIKADRTGDLTTDRGVIFKRPRVYQANHGRKVEVSSSYRVSRDGLVRFRLGKYDANATLVIDPAVIYSTPLGGVGGDAGYATAVDAAGNMYVAGESDSAGFGGSARRSSKDAFVAKINSAGVPVFVAYFGGSGLDSAQGIAVDATGSLFVAGTTSSFDFPVTSGALGTRNSGQADAFVLKLDGAGNVIYSTYLGSSGEDRAYGIAVDAAGGAYVAGSTTSLSFPGTAGKLRPSNGGGASDCFIAKLNPGGSSLQYATFLGGAGLDICRGIAVDGAGNAYVTGTTYSTDFPILGAIQSFNGGGGDAFAAKLNPTGSALVFSTFIGGMSIDEGNAIAVDSQGTAYIAGYTGSINFPLTSGAYQTTLKGSYNAFLVKLTTAGNAISFASLLGGTAVDTATAIALDNAGQATIGGFTSSPDLPTVNALQSASNGYFDGFVAVFNSLGNALVYSSYIGGDGDDRVYGVAVGSGNAVFVTGMSSSSNFPAVTGTSNGYDAFAYEITYTAQAGIPLAFIPIAPCRIADTRGYSGFFGPPFLQAGIARSFALPATNCRIPNSAQAYSLNVTVLPRAPLSSLIVWPTGQPQPAVATSISLDSRIVAVAAIVAAGTGGAVSAIASSDSDLIIDVSGYFDQVGSPQGLAFYTMPPCRLVDTRGYSIGALSPPALSRNVSRDFLLMTAPGCAIPAAGNTYSLNITALPRTSSFPYLAIWPVGQPYPTVSTLNSYNGQVVANATIMPTGPMGGITMYAGDDAEVLVDINGYFAPPGNPGALYFRVLPNCRAADTRGQGITGALGPPSMPVSTRSFPLLQSSCGIPVTAQAFALNVAVFPPGPMGYLSLWPAGQPYPTVSTLNSYNGAVVSNFAIVPSGLGGAVYINVGDPTDVVITTLGYFAP